MSEHILTISKLSKTNILNKKPACKIVNDSCMIKKQLGFIKYISWDFFDNECQQEQSMCGGGAALHILDIQSLKLTMRYITILS